MRIIIYLMLLFYPHFLCALNINIKVIPLDGKPVYLLELAGFLSQKEAFFSQKKFAKLTKYPIKIDNLENKENYRLQIGPLSDYTLARDLEKKINSFADNQELKTPVSTYVPPQKIWNLNNADIRAVIAEISRVTHKNFLIDPRVQGKISIISSTPMSDDALYQVFLSMLQVSGYAAIPSANIIKIIPSMDAKTQSSDLLSQMRNPPQGDDMMVQVIPVHHVPSEQLVPVLRPLMPQWSNVSAYQPSNMLILTGRASNIKQLTHIIKQVDSPTASGVDMIPLKYALAMDILATLKELVKATPGAHNQATYAADDRSNAILLSGNQNERLKLRVIIAQLDKRNPNGNNSNTQVIYLNYLRAEDVVPILAGIAQANFSGNVGTTIGTITAPVLDSTNPASSVAGNSTGTGQASASPAAVASPVAIPNTNNASTQNEGSTKPTVQIIAEPNTNSIIINAPATLIRILKAVITKLDIKPAQLLIEALVAEINEEDFNDLGIEWGSIDQNTKLPGTFRPGFAIINSKLSIEQFQAQIYALSRLNKANILSTPSVVVLDNRQAKILIGKQVSVASSSYPNNANGTGVATPYTTFDRVNVALHLYVRPQITRGMGIQMQIDQGNDTLEPASVIDPSTNPTFNISAIVTSIHIESGDIVVLGGLSQDSIATNNNSLPILGKIPGLGRLFQRKVNNREKKILMVFIRPRILPNERDALQVSGGKYNDLRRYQLESLRTQEYNKKNKETVLPALQTAILPRPFSPSFVYKQK